MPGYPSFLVTQASASLGVWVLRIAQDWLVIQKSHSPVALGTVAALQFLPLVLLAPFSGVIADRYSSRTVLLVTQNALWILPAVAAVLIAIDQITMPYLYAFAFLLGVSGAVDGPSRQNFINTLVGPAHLGNAVSLSSAAFSLSGLAGPLLAAWLMGPLGIAGCFALTAVGYLPNLVVIIRSERIVRAVDPVPTRIIRQLVEGVRHVATRRRLAVPMIMVAVIGALGTALPVLLMSFSTRVFHSGASGYAQLTAATSFGSFVGSFLSARYSGLTIRQLFLAAFVIGVGYTVAAAAPNRVTFAVLLFLTGAVTLFFLVAALTMLQTSADTAMRGRVYSIYAIALVGGTPICGPLAGQLTELFGARAALVSCALAAILAIAALAYRTRPHHQDRYEP